MQGCPVLFKRKVPTRPQTRTAASRSDKMGLPSTKAPWRFTLQEHAEMEASSRLVDQWRTAQESLLKEPYRLTLTAHGSGRGRAIKLRTAVLPDHIKNSARALPRTIVQALNQFDS